MCKSIRERTRVETRSMLPSMMPPSHSPRANASVMYCSSQSSTRSACLTEFRVQGHLDLNHVVRVLVINLLLRVLRRRLLVRDLLLILWVLNRRLLARDLLLLILPPQRNC